MSSRGRLDAWTDDLVTDLRAMWAVGHSARTIADALGNGFTRCAVLGKARRLNLAERKQGPTADERHRNKLEAAARRNAAKRDRRGSPRMARIPPDLPAEPLPPPLLDAPEPLRIPFLAMREGQCRDVCGHDGRLALFCGHPTVAGTSWCTWHARVNFRRGAA
jgi:GcrA cell cycle regulator